ncbi:MAG: HD domain-containing protein [Candidatus Marinimicrobia bacterium]|nr:HD domain-containing protein [Candidatus Neomarinimicrobiota bacterium]MBT4735095.1 HD domain-containing protein [Candidatus Neomarinimicrobiota bacterium]MBT6112631.1 HD domain-containing protein [Candidatus Neomarinimicrobiota bacterium]MBT6472606.1 HD domain-containing protein [Candidatus Neomarinimicrobiota bacterium]MBT7269883.1 HD domain-containing protein [Candidatus Neomarinimicrobiota bacterium]
MKPVTSIKKFKEGAKVQGFFLCTEKHLRHTRSGDLYLDVTLRDQTGQINAKIWDKVAELNDLFSSGDAVVASGKVETFLDRPQLVIQKIKMATVKSYGRYGFDPAKIVPSSRRNPAKMWEEITQIIKGMKNKHLQQLVSKIYRQNKKLILTHPASVKMHHNYRSGFMEHTLSMARIAKRLANHYKMDRDLLLAGVFLHDIGKIREINSEFEADYTDEGKLIGHISIGRQMVHDEIQTIKKFPEDLALKIEHMVLSHQGRYEWQSPKKPKFREALLLHMIDNLDASINLMDIAIAEDQDNGKFTSRHNYYRIPILKESDGTK